MFDEKPNVELNDSVLATGFNKTLTNCFDKVNKSMSAGITTVFSTKKMTPRTQFNDNTTYYSATAAVMVQMF